MRLKDSNLLLQTALNPVTNDNAVKLLETDFMFLPGIHFIAAVTKHGKTNFAANLVCSVLREKPSKKIFVGLNEETAEDFIIRCGCIWTGLSFIAWKTRNFTSSQKQQLTEALHTIIHRVKFSDETMNLGCLEDVETTVRVASKNENVSLVIFDYLQNVYLSKNFPGKTQYEISKLLGVRLKDIGKTATAPIIVFGQLKDDSEAGFKSRVEGDSWFVNNVATGIELIADKHVKQSRAIVHVDRFQGRTHDEFYFQHQQSGKLTNTPNPNIITED
jgi:replicative DNA helicase